MMNSKKPCLKESDYWIILLLLAKNLNTLFLGNRIILLRNSYSNFPYRKHERKIVRGYNGQITKMANRLRESQDPVVIQYTEASEAWQDFVENHLAKINEKNDTKLGERYEDEGVVDLKRNKKVLKLNRIL